MKSRYIIIFCIMFLPIYMDGQEIFKNRRVFNIKRAKPNVESPRRKTIIPNKKKKMVMTHSDSLEVEYQKWLHREPLTISTSIGDFHEYAKPKLPEFNPEKMEAPKVTYKFDKGILVKDMLPSPSSGFSIGFDFGQLINQSARDHARDLKHLETAKKLMKDY